MSAQGSFEEDAAACGYTYENSWSVARDKPGWFKHVKRDGSVQLERASEREVSAAVRRVQARRTVTRESN